MSPTFDFECLGCGIVEVYVRPFDDSNVPVCLECGQPTKRLFPVPTVVYKGDGWAKKDREGKSNGKV
jgi:putative FmdB family regulatory protein